MMILKLAYRNFFRNTRRSIISGISIAIAITLIIFTQSYIKGVIKNMTDNVVKLISGHIRITSQEYTRRERMLPLSEALYLTSEFYQSIKTDEILYVAPRIKFGVLLGQDELSSPSLGYAIDPQIEQHFSGLHTRIVQGKYLDPVANNVILGKELAKHLNLEVGDTLTLITRTAYDSPTGANLVISGIFSVGIGGMDRNMFYIPLAVGQRLLDLEDRATEVAIILKAPNQSLKIAKQIQNQTELSVMPYQHNPILKSINIAVSVFSLFYIIVLVVACSTIANTMIMIVYERTREIGMLKAMGMTNFAILKLLVLEAGIIGLLGSLVGAIFGGAMSYWLKFQGLDISSVSASASADMPFGPVIYFAPTPLIIIVSFVIGLFVTMLVALLPISRATKLEPAKALKTIT
jgi:putative ABC transport system permease protein